LTINDAKVNDTYKPRKLNQSVVEEDYNEVNRSSYKAEERSTSQKKKDELKSTDILTLKKMVIDEIKSELELNKGLP
jgi:hypothetical protein